MNVRIKMKNKIQQYVGTVELNVTKYIPLTENTFTSRCTILLFMHNIRSRNIYSNERLNHRRALRVASEHFLSFARRYLMVLKPEPRQ